MRHGRRLRHERERSESDAVFEKKGLSIDTLIGEDSAIDGDLVFAGGLRLDGRVRGNVTAAPGKPSMLVVSEKGVVEGEISVGHLVLNGTVKGPVQATDLLELQPHARVLGDVRYAALEMHQARWSKAA